MADKRELFDCFHEEWTHIYISYSGLPLLSYIKTQTSVELCKECLGVGCANCFESGYSFYSPKQRSRIPTPKKTKPKKKTKKAPPT